MAWIIDGKALVAKLGQLAEKTAKLKEETKLGFWFGGVQFEDIPASQVYDS